MQLFLVQVVPFQPCRIALAGFMLSICAVEAWAAPILIVCIGADNTAGRGTGRRHPGGVARDQAFPLNWNVFFMGVRLIPMSSTLVFRTAQTPVAG
ncbi:MULTISPECIES: hypothetical protein [unclassified Rhizobium]|uniref:hypothetical protein n=1 Tax=unclassified Rhizobium TaxID=2613769 RepID=UPI0016102DE9|nr:MULTISPECIES: hypothetical protein [unclassified Rhizobium]MBB3319269.1 hypothetical protein [Rhizobium sp. BK181]MBB3542994.1 hypothetical protein [Rhizobium sp. BK399]MCS3743094.1 hypothetical protein [Rhizobium sp. BK661]MCS4094933.1 hypothetical protein [Rhizobium sp. BK176]